MTTSKTAVSTKAGKHSVNPLDSMVKATVVVSQPINAERLAEAKQIVAFNNARARAEREAKLTENEKLDKANLTSDVRTLTNALLGPNQLITAMKNKKDSLVLLNSVCKNPNLIEKALNVKTFCEFIAPKWYQAKWEKVPDYGVQVKKAYEMVVAVFSDPAKERLFLEYLGKRKPVSKK